MTRSGRIGIAAAGVAAAVLAGGAFLLNHRRATEPVDAGPSGQPRSYRADVHRSTEGPDGSSSADETVAYDGDRARHEWTEAGRRYALITLPDGSWLVDRDRNAYVALGDTPVAAPGALTGEQIEALIRADASPGTSEPVSVERETLDGHPCRVVRTRLVGVSGGASESTIWSALDLDGLVIRAELADADGVRTVTELRNVTTTVDPGLFELPHGATVDPQLAPR